MSNSPFEIFRRNLKPLMVLLTGLALFAFVALPALDGYLRRSAGAGSDPVLASFDGQDLRRSRIDYFTRNHQSTLRFLRELAEETIRRGGYPKTPGFEYDEQNNRVTALGINERPSELASIRTLQFSAEAKRQGFELDDTAIQEWLDRFTDGWLTDAEINGLLLQSTSNAMGQYHLYEQLRQQLMASLFQREAFSAVADGQMPMMTPAEQWDNFLRLNRQATINAYGVLVNDYFDQTNDSPSLSEIESVYGEGKERFPSDQSPDPGFAERETITVEYVVANLQDFIDREAKKFTEEELRAEYEKRLKGGEFQLPESPLNTESPLDIEMPDKNQAGESETPEAPPEEPNKDASAKPDDASPAEGSGESNADDAKSTEDDSPSKADSSSSKSDEAPESKAPESKEPESKEPESKEPESKEPESKEPESKEPEPKEPESKEQSQSVPATAVRLVALQDDPQNDADTPEDGSGEPDSNGGEPDADKPDTDKPDADKPDADKPDADKPDADKPDADKPDADKPDADKPDADKPDADKPDADKPDADKPDAGSKQPEADSDDAKPDAEGEAKKPDDDPPAKAEPKVESFEDVRNRIADELARPAAAKQLDAAITAIYGKLRLYFNKKAIYDSNVSIGQATEEPVRPDLDQLADEFGMQYRRIGPHDVISIADEPIAESFEVGSQLMQRGPPFATMMFGFQNSQTSIPQQQLYSPLRTADDQTGKIYVSWKTAETEDRVPELEEVRDEVIRAIRMMEARKLATEAAQKLAKQVNESGGKTLAEIVPADRKDNIKEGLGPFSWMNTFGFMRASIGNVPELDSVGNAFMRAVFTTDVGKYAVGSNEPQRVVYVVEPIEFQPPIEELRRRFKQPRERMMSMLIGNEQTDTIINAYYETVDERSNFKFAAPPE